MAKILLGLFVTTAITIGGYKYIYIPYVAAHPPTVSSSNSETPSGKNALNEQYNALKNHYHY